LEVFLKYNITLKKLIDMNLRLIATIAYFLCSLLYPSHVTVAENPADECRKEINAIADEIKALCVAAHAEGKAVDQPMKLVESTRKLVGKVERRKIGCREALSKAEGHLEQAKTQIASAPVAAPATSVVHKKTDKKDKLDKKAEKKVKFGWKNPEKYLAYAGAHEIKPKLVVGCGHYDTSTKHYPDHHGADTTSKNHQVTHSESFTINKEGTTKLLPDIDGNFPSPKFNKAKNAFAEVYFESVPRSEDAMEKFYKAAFKLLKSGGVLVDDRFYNNWPGDDSIETVKATTKARLEKAGFKSADISFKKNYVNPRNGRKEKCVVFAVKQ
jgi:hypothetical protein